MWIELGDVGASFVMATQGYNAQIASPRVHIAFNIKASQLHSKYLKVILSYLQNKFTIQ